MYRHLDGDRGEGSTLRLGQTALACGGLLWLSVVAIGLWFLWDYANAPGRPAEPPARWPERTGLAQEAGSATLVMFAHPRCPCTRASIGELARVLSRPQGPVVSHVVFFRPENLEAGWEKTDLWTSAERIPGVRVHRDDDGALARRFGVATSGQVLLYGSDDRLRFSGGITAARGHAGDSVGGTLVHRLIANDDGPTPAQASVFGCALLGGECADCCTDGGCAK